MPINLPVQSKRRVLQGLIASGVGIFVALALQVLVVPVFLQAGGPNFLGQWINFLALITLASQSDLGSMDAVAAEGAKAFLGGNEVVARELISSGLTLLQFVWVGVAAVVGIGSIWILPDSMSWGAVACASAAAAFSQGQRLAHGCFRARGLYGRGLAIINITRVAEVLIICIVGYVWPRIDAVAVSFTICRILFTLLIAVMTKSICDWPLAHAPIKSMRRLRPLHPAITGNLSMNGGLAALNSGFIFFITLAFGAFFSAFFATTRTLTRIVVQVALPWIQSNTLEVGHLEGEGEFHKAKKVWSAGLSILLVGMIAFSFIINIAGSQIYEIWTLKSLAFNKELTTLLLLDGTLLAVWMYCFEVLRFRGAQRSVGIICLMSQCIALAACSLWYWLGLSFDLLQVAACHTIANAIIACYALAAMLKYKPTTTTN